MVVFDCFGVVLDVVDFVVIVFFVWWYGYFWWVFVLDVLLIGLCCVV